jgi:predicted transcriptional regulator
MRDRDKKKTEQSLAGLTAEIAAAYVSRNVVTTNDIARLIAEIGRQLSALGKDEPASEKPQPAVPVRRSISSDYLVCLVCGVKQRMLKRHLSSEHQLTPDEYRRLFDLKPAYPMVAPSYADMRRDLALKIGLGRPKKEVPKKLPASKKAAAPAEAKQAKPGRTRTRTT